VAARDAPSATEGRDYLENYGEHITRIGMTAETFAERCSVPMRIKLVRLRGH